MLFQPWHNEFCRLISHADDDQAFRISFFPSGIQVRKLAKARASPSAEDFHQNGVAFHILRRDRRRVEPSGVGKVRHRARPLRIGRSGECECGTRDKEVNHFHADCGNGGSGVLQHDNKGSSDGIPGKVIPIPGMKGVRATDFY